MKLAPRFPIFLCGILSCISITHANELDDEKTIIKIDADQVSAIKLILTQPNISTRAKVTEKSLPNYGCTYDSSNNPDKAESLIKIINSGLHQIDGETQDFALRNAIYIFLKDGGQMKFLLSDSNNADNLVYGSFQLGKTSKLKQAQGEDKILRELRLWASNDVNRKAHSLGVCEFNNSY